jgi:hypothetical protein
VASACDLLGRKSEQNEEAVLPALDALLPNDRDRSFLADCLCRGIRRAGTLVTARVPDGDRAKCETILSRASVNIQERGAAYREAGWKEFDASATPYTADQVRQEREFYR